MKLRIDFETYSEVDIKAHGSYIYATHHSTRILMMAYTEHNKETKLWLPGQEIPEEVLRADRFYAQNAVFEYMIFKNCGEAVGLPTPKLSQFIDVMALCGKYAYPLDLAKAAKALGVTDKDPMGTRLIKQFCTPQGGGTPQSHPLEWQDFKQYCMQDVDTMAEVIIALPHHELSPYEQRLWELTQEINFRGVPVCREEAKAVFRYVEMYKETHAERLPDLTGGNVTKATQIQRIKRWCEAEGYPMPDGLGALLIEEALEGPNPPPEHIAEVLEIRKEMGSSSANKFKLAQNYEQGGRIHMSFIKNGATTGRYASWNFQMHNLAKLRPLEDPDVLFKKFMDIEEIDKPFRAAKSLVRALIKAPAGQKLCVADWAGIETALLFWFIDDLSTLDVLHKRGDLYRLMASDIYGVPSEQVCKDTQRPLGKALILGCGYGMGFKRFKEAAKSFGVYIELPEANLAVAKYRLKFPLVQRAWYSLTNAARQAVLNPGVEKPCLKVSFMSDGNNLWTKLPSGRKLCYPQVSIKEGDIQFYGAHAQSGQWVSKRLTPSINIENIIQAIAADILELSVVNIADHLPRHEHIGHVHDENITLTPEGYTEALDDLISVMCQPIPWAPNLPLFAEGYIADRFKK